MNYKNYDFNEEKIAKRNKLIDMGINPYPYSFKRTERVKDIIQQVEIQEKKKEEINLECSVCGRIWAKRSMGRAIFLDLKDESSKIQLYINKNNFKDEVTFKIIQLLDVGDIVGLSGNVFRTKKGELSINVNVLKILSKTTVPIAVGKETDEKTFNRQNDIESKYRERYLTWLLDPVEKNRILIRNQILLEVRKWMTNKGFIEVSTPNIEFVYGGGEARPFKTNIWALGNKEAFLRISPELYLKRYIVGGFDKVFTICQNYRNEGIDYSHNPEFTMMEWYESYTDYNQQMENFENLVEHLCLKIHGKTNIKYQDTDIEFKTPWKRLTMLDCISEILGFNPNKMDIFDLKNELNKRNIEYNDGLSWGKLVSFLFEEYCEEKLIQPTFIIDHPIDISPLTKVKRGDSRLVERFEPFAYAMELGNAYSELTDPIEQLNRLIDQKKSQTNIDDQGYTDNPIDIDFIKAIGCGMPPTGGAGIGIDRIIMLLTDSKSIRDITPFPMVKPKE